MNGQWVPFGAGSTVGYRRLIKGQPVDSRYIRVAITDAQATPILNGVSVYKTPASIEETDGYPLIILTGLLTGPMVSGMKREKVFEAPLCGPRKKELR